jgi:anti-anti-sigma factor
MPDPLEFQTHAETDGFRIAVRGEIDMATVCDLEARANVVLERLEPRVVVDCHGVTFIDSTGLDALVELHHALEAQNRKLTICGLSDTTRRPFEATRLDEVLDLQ